jgi:hypothetical protein
LGLRRPGFRYLPVGEWTQRLAAPVHVHELGSLALH